MSSRASLHVEGMNFSDCKNETKNLETKFGLVIGI
jgi:hypothetical protein